MRLRVAGREHLFGALRGPDPSVGAVLVDEQLRCTPDVHAGSRAAGSMHSGLLFFTLLTVVLT